jgi:hypothetical protein
MVGNKSTMNCLLNFAMLSWQLPSHGAIYKGRCWKCLHEAFKKCGSEHPDWFRVNQTLKRRYREEAERYLLDNTPELMVMFRERPVLVDEDRDIWTHEQFGTCKRHLQEAVDSFDSPRWKI